ncbi:MAG: pantoate--beta-alanine ligase [Actinobacteria bacterium]|nr:pantoate--beta-alanine ligase [Thermoleophilia bacterium]MCB9012108.1 pantoate--beta-alanine ligase [Actinomycetota bacterium]
MSEHVSDRTPVATPSRPATTVVRTVADVRAAADALRAEGSGVALVPTMGALHDGHLELVRRAARDGHAPIVSIFVNPTQFAAGEDLSSYPRREARDVDLAGTAGARAVFAPDVDEVYPEGFATTVSVAGPAEGLEGASRPTHFAGVATVVAKLLLMVRPDRVVFGQKDAQQVAVIRRMMRDLHLDDIEFVVVPTVRERDGLAMSSRNAYLSDTERQVALALSRGLADAADRATAGERDGRTLEDAAMETMRSVAGVEPEYAALVDPDTFQRVPTLVGPATLCVAARVGPARLIDNAVIPIN